MVYIIIIIIGCLRGTAIYGQIHICMYTHCICTLLTSLEEKRPTYGQMDNHTRTIAFTNNTSGKAL